MNCPREYCAWRKALYTFVLCLMLNFLSSFLVVWVGQTLRYGCQSTQFIWEMIPGCPSRGVGQWNREETKANTGCLIEEVTSVQFLADVCSWLWVILSKKSEHWGIYTLTPVSHWLRPAPWGCGNAACSGQSRPKSGGQRNSRERVTSGMSGHGECPVDMGGTSGVYWVYIISRTLKNSVFLNI